MGAEAAEISRELQRQHGHSAIGKVDAGATQSCLLIESRIGCDVVSHVRYVDLEFVIVAFDLPDSYRVVEVACRLAVDSVNRESAELTPLFNFGRRDHGFHVLRFVEHFRRKMVRYMKFADDDFNIDAEIVFVTEDLNHSSPGVP